MKRIASSIRAAGGLLAAVTLLFGGVYPLLVTAVAQAVFYHQANGSLIEQNGKVIGSALLGQEFSSDRYFWGRLSATAPAYNAAASAATNYNPANPRLLEAANVRIKALQQADPDNKARIPVELITSSASGLDPHIGVAAVEYQLQRVARARHMKKEAVRALVDKYTEHGSASLLAEPYVNVLLLNIALDETQGKKS